ncbi:MAG: alpha/beta hydrolase [Firmicutes bacterium]|nr:alpha/beta hydrolase [Bacillota bacterium]
MSNAASAEKDRQMDQRLHDEFFSEEGKAKRKKNIHRFFWIALALVIVLAFVNWGVVTGFGNVKITRTTITGPDGVPLSALVYIPSNATDETPAPAIMCTHGNAGNARNHESWAVEFARRGFVVMSIDQYGAGDSGQYLDSWALNEAAMVYVADAYYNVLASMRNVDASKIIPAGHSMGCCTAKAMAVKHNTLGVINASGMGMSFYGKELSEAWSKYTGNVLTTNGDVESPAEKFIADTMKAAPALEGRAGYSGGDIELDKLYGSFESGNAFYATRDYQRIHEAAFVNQGAIEKLIWFAQETVGQANVPNYIEASNQIWMYKDYVGLAGILCFGALICAIALMLIEGVPAFSSVKQPLPRNLGLRGKGFAISAICGIIFPWIVLKTGTFGILTPKNKNAIRAGFNLTYANVAFFTIIGLSVLGVLTFILFCCIDGKKHKMTASDLGMTAYGEKKVTFSYIWKTILVATATLAISFGLILLQETITGTDFYAWFFGFKSIPLFKIPYFLPYICIWVPCFVLSNLGNNIERRLPTTGVEWKDTLRAIVINVILAEFTLVLIIALKWHFQSVGSAADTSFLLNFNADTQRLWGMPAGMAVGVGGSTYLFRKTGNLWLSAILMGTVACLTCVLFGQLRV